MASRRKFISTVAAGLAASAGFLSLRTAKAQTAGGGTGSWAGATPPDLLAKVFAIRFTNPLPWALDPTNTVLAKVLNVDANGNVPLLGVTLKTGLPPLGFIMKPDSGTTNVFSVKAGQTPWPMLGPLGGKFADGSAIPQTTVWGYGNHDLEQIFTNGTGLGVTFPGRSFVVQRGTPITVNWYNNLVDEKGKPLPHLLGVDQTIAMQTDAANVPINGVPIAVHHHGGNNAAEFDGGPDQWFTPRRQQIGVGVGPSNSSPGSDHLGYTYLNNDEASLHWYHDHAEGVTRINAYAGLAGLFVIRDPNETALINALLLPRGAQELPLVLQDKVFQQDGSLAYTGDAPDFNGWNTLNPGATRLLPGFGSGYDPNDSNTVVTGTQPTHVPEMFGDVICVNGVSWPSSAVQRRPYRLRLLNGSDSRVYNLRFGGLYFYQISTDLGFLNVPVYLTSITIFPGERKDIFIDFTQVAQGGKVVVTNDAPFPYPSGNATLPTDPWATVMRFDVSLPFDQTVPKVYPMTPLTPLRGFASGTPLIPPYLAVPPGLTTRRVMLGEGCDEYGRIMPLIGTVSEGTKTFHDPADIFPKLGSTEVWEFWNSTVDAHPIHMHLVRFRIVNRQPFTGSTQALAMANGWTGVSFTAPPVATGLATPAPLTEQGWKDTVVCPPGQVTRIVATFDKPGKFVYHCHILGHEEHDMMRWYVVS
jgi:spore coat protein A